MRVAAHPGLYDPDDEVPNLRGTRCEACGTSHFPPLTLGCEVCGASPPQLLPAVLAAAGVLHSLATVYLHEGGDVEVPFAVAEVRLDDGPLVRATLADPLPLEAIGERVRARWAILRTRDDGAAVVEPRFALASGGGSA